MEYLAWVFLAISILFIVIFVLMTARLNRLEEWNKVLGEYCNCLRDLVVGLNEVDTEIIKTIKSISDLVIIIGEKEVKNGNDN